MTIRTESDSSLTGDLIAFLFLVALAQIFNNSKLVVTTFDDAMLLKLLLVGLLFDCLVLSLRSGLAPYILDEQDVCTFESGSHEQVAEALNIILIVTKAIMIVAAAWLSYAVRNLPQLYNEVGDKWKRERMMGGD
jgi:cytochrome bd-type quinol oxidase subunit 2